MEIHLNNTVLRRFCEDVSKKDILAVKEPDVVQEFLKYIQMQNEWMKTCSAYEIASTMRSFGTWYLNKDKEPKKNHIAKYRDVYYVDLGAYNLKYESGFIHPCIVIRRYGTNVLVAPCSSKKYGKKDDIFFDIKKGKVFRENTAVLLDQVRNVSVTRLKTKMGQVEPEIFDDLIDKLIEKYFCKKNKEFNDLKTKNKKLEIEVNQKTEEIVKLQEELNYLKDALGASEAVSDLEN